MEKFESAHQRAAAAAGKLPAFLTSDKGELDPDMLSLGGDSAANEWEGEVEEEDALKQQESQAWWVFK